MKITHNKLGQNLNLVDSAKTDKANSAASPKASADAKLSALSEAGLGNSASKVSVSDRAQEAKRIKELAMAAPDVDEAKVAKFQKMIDEGTYKIDAGAIADKMVDEHIESGF